MEDLHGDMEDLHGDMEDLHGDEEDLLDRDMEDLRGDVEDLHAHGGSAWRRGGSAWGRGERKEKQRKRTNYIYVYSSVSLPPNYRRTYSLPFSMKGRSDTQRYAADCILHSSTLLDLH